MNHIDKLLLKAKKTVKPGVYSAFCIIDKDETTGKWIAVPQLWDGVLYSGNMDSAIPADWKREYDTKEAAAEAVSRFFDTLDIQSGNQAIILFDDVGE